MTDDELFSTNSYDDPDPDGTDVYGMIPLLAEIEDDEDNHDDDSGADDEDDQELPPAIEASSIEVDVPPGTTFEDDDDAFQSLTARGATDMFPGEARALIKYMRPLTPEEQDIADDPFLNDLRWIDDPAHTTDVLKAGQGERGLDSFLDDATYGDIHMKTPEEIAERHYGNDKSLRTSIVRPRRKLQPENRREILRLTNAAVVVGLAKKLKVEHANWLAEQDKSAGVAVRPRSFYENVGKLWAAKQIKDAKIPTKSSLMTARPKKFVDAAGGVLAKTTSSRSRFSPALGDQVDMGGWNPYSAAKSALKTAVKYTIAKPLQYTYKYGKKVAVAPFTYTYKGIKYVGDKAKWLALAPLRAIIRRYTGTMVNRRANALAKQRGLKAPTALEKASAANWAKNFVRQKGGKYGGAIASLMGNDPDYGMRDVDITFGDVMGLSKASTAGLILLGPIGLIAILTGLVKTSEGSGAPPPTPGTPEMDAEAAAAAEEGSADPYAEDPGAGDPGDGSADPGAYADDESTDSSGRTSNRTQRSHPQQRRKARGQTQTKRKPQSTPAMRTATSNPAFKSAFHKMQIDNTPFTKLSSDEQDAINQYRRALGKSDLSGHHGEILVDNHITIEKLNTMSPRQRARAQNLIRTGLLRLA
jgi:hypothetical protein